MPSASRPMPKGAYLALRRRVGVVRARQIALSGHGAYRTRRRRSYKPRGKGAYGGFARRTASVAIGQYLGNKLSGQGRYRRRRRMGGKGAYFHSEQGRISQMVPSFGSGNEEFTITFREYLGDIYSSAEAGAFDPNYFDINPGLADSFPWLNSIARNFQMYRLEQCVYEYRTFSADALNSVNTALGAVCAAVDYDSSSPDFTTRQQIENSAFSMSAKPSESFLIPVECSRRQTFSSGNLYVRSGAVPTGADVKTYDVGRLTIATVGFQGQSVLAGSLYCAYKFTFFKPIMLRPLSQQLIFNIALGTDTTNTTLWGSASSATASTFTMNTLGASFVGNDLTIPARWFQPSSIWLFMYFVYGTSTAGVDPVGVAITELSQVNIFASGGQYVALPNNQTGTSSAFWGYYQAPDVPMDTDPVITLTPDVLPADITAGIATFLQITGDFDSSFN